MSANTAKIDQLEAKIDILKLADRLRNRMTNSSVALHRDGMLEIKLREWELKAIIAKLEADHD